MNKKAQCKLHHRRGPLAITGGLVTIMAFVAGLLVTASEPKGSTEIGPQPPRIWDHNDRKLHDCSSGSSQKSLNATVQLVDGRKGGYHDEINQVYRFPSSTMAHLSDYAGGPRRLCRVWPEFGTQPILHGQSGVLLEDGTVLTSAHLVTEETVKSWFVVAARTDELKLVTDDLGRTWVEVPEKQVRSIQCVLDCHYQRGSDGKWSDWIWLKIQNSSSASDALPGLTLAESVDVDSSVVASFHPLGLPAKCSHGVAVEYRNAQYAVAIDHAAGASGGALLDTKSGAVAGIISGPVASRSSVIFETVLQAFTTAEYAARLSDILDMILDVIATPDCIRTRAYVPDRFTPAQTIRADMDYVPKCKAKLPTCRSLPKE